MPIRMVKDGDGGQKGRDRYPGKRSQNSRQTTGGGNNIIGLVLGVLLKKPKIGIPVLIIGVIIYFVFLRGSDNASSFESGSQGLGCEMSQEVYDEAEVFEPLADNTKNPLPEKVTLSPNCPDRLNQGQQGSCVGWASSYAARTILHSRATGQDPDNVSFSPSYLYNQIALPGCNGTYIVNAMDKLLQEGTVPFTRFGYNDQNCSEQPDGGEKQLAAQYRIKGYNRLTYAGDDYTTDLLAIKQNLAQGAPVVIGMMVGGSFMQEMHGQDVWYPTDYDYSMRGFGGHAMCVVGYDDYHEGGAFQLMNSWGPEWGRNGFGWVRYKDFDYFTREAYGLYPMGSADVVVGEKLTASFGIVNNQTQQNIALRQKDGNVFETVSPIAKGTKFKVEIANNKECYVYVLGMETDGSSYVLFPYTKKHSPYCGITGTRLFPRDYSMMADDIGTRDYVAVVFTAQPIDYTRLNNTMNQAGNGAFADRLNSILRDELAQDIRYRTAQNVLFECDLTTKNAVAFVLEIQKQ